MKYKVYRILPNIGYCGIGLVAAEDVSTANIHIENFIKNDRYDFGCSKGFIAVCDFDCIPELYSEKEGIIYNGITRAII